MERAIYRSLTEQARSIKQTDLFPPSDCGYNKIHQKPMDVNLAEINVYYMSKHCGYFNSKINASEPIFIHCLSFFI